MLSKLLAFLKSCWVGYSLEICSVFKSKIDKCFCKLSNYKYLFIKNAFLLPFLSLIEESNINFNLELEEVQKFIIYALMASM